MKAEINCPYYKKKLKKIIKNMESYTPEDMLRELSSLAEVARRQVIESQPISERMVGGDLDGTYGY